MKRTLSKQKHTRKHLSNSDQRTQRKKAQMAQYSKLTKSSIWLNKQKVPIIFKQQAINQTYFKQYSSIQYLQQKLLPIYNPSSVKFNRAKVIDWLLGVSSAFHLRWQTYWCTVQLLDYLIQNSDNQLNHKALHLISTTCLFISCKIHQTYPPTLQYIISNAVYNLFSSQHVIQMEASIILFCANNPQNKPKYLTTVYNTLYEKYPQLPASIKVQILRRLVLLWMDPVMALNRNKILLDQMKQIKQFRQNKSYSYTNNQVKSHVVQRTISSPPMISYNDLVTIITSSVLEDSNDMLKFQNVQEFYRQNCDCTFTQEHWAGLDNIRL